jgi:hypothetical protein
MQTSALLALALFDKPGEPKMTKITTKRYLLVNRKSLNTRRAVATRQMARDAKRTTERIYDTAKAAYIR